MGQLARSFAGDPPGLHGISEARADGRDQRKAGRMTVVDLPTADRWLDLNELAHYLGCSKRALSYDIAKYRETSDPFPVEMIYGRLKAKVKDAEAWLERHDRKRRVA